MLSTWTLVLLLLTGLATLGLGVYAWRQRRAPGTRPMAAVLALSGIWSLAYSIQLLNSDLDAKIVAFKVYFTVVPLIPVVWAVLGVELRQRAFWFTWPRFAALLVVPAITITLTWTVEAHPWLFPNLRVMESPPLLLLDSDIGPWFWIHTVYSYVLILSGTAFLIPRMLSERGLYRWQAGLLALAPLVPLGANLVYILGLTPPPRLDFTPQGFSASALLIAWAVFRYRLLDLMPIAHRFVVEGLGDEVLVFNESDHLVDLNPAARRRFPAAAPGTPARAALVDWPDLLDLYAHPGPQSRDVRLSGQAEESTWIEARLQDLTADHEQRVGRVVVLRDITPRKRAEAAMALARDRAVEASELKSQILAKVSHELRTPIGALLGYAELLQSGAYGPITEQQMAAAERMIQNSKSLGRLVGELLDQAQLESGRLRLAPRATAIETIIENVQEALLPLARSRALTLAFEIDTRLPAWIEIDPDRLQQVLLNLAHNALKFTDRGGVQVRANVVGDQTWQLIVQDTGKGLSPEAQNRIFDPFWQADSSLTRIHGGYGLGLTIVRQLVDLMEGQITVDSALGAGSTFIVRLPLISAETPESQPVS